MGSTQPDEARVVRTRVASSFTAISENERRELVKGIQLDIRSLRHVLATARILHRENVNVAKGAGYNSQILFVPPNIALARLANLKSLGFKVDNALVKAPQLLCSLPQTVSDCFEYLKSQGIDVASITSRVPGIFTFSKELIARKLEILRKQGFNIIWLVNFMPEILRCDLSKADTRLATMSNLGLNIEKVAPHALGRSIEAILERIDYLQERGFDAIKVINNCPSIVGLSLAQIEAKVQNFVSLGLDAKLVINGSPEVLKYAIPSLRTKFMVIQSACRAWGFGDGRAKACELLEDYPKLFTSSPHKIRALIRMASAIMPEEARNELVGKNVYPMTVRNLEEVLTGALEYKSKKHKPLGKKAGLKLKVETASDWRSLDKQYKGLAKTALAEIIELHPKDRAVKIYRKGLQKAA